SNLLWAGMGYFGSAGSLMYAALTQQFPRELAGRVTTALNLVLFVMIFVLQWVLGIVIGLWTPDAAGHYPVIAFQVSFGGCAVALASSLLWYLWCKPETAGENS
ncbi:MAG: MFS transporter, partial [Natronospirillum sp.]